MVLFLLDPRTDSLLDLETDSKATGQHKASYLSQESEFGKENQCRFFSFVVGISICFPKKWEEQTTVYSFLILAKDTLKIVFACNSNNIPRSIVRLAISSYSVTWLIPTRWSIHVYPTFRNLAIYRNRF